MLDRATAPREYLSLYNHTETQTHTHTLSYLLGLDGLGS